MTRKEINALRREIERAEEWMRIQRSNFLGSVKRLRRARAALAATEQST